MKFEAGQHIHLVGIGGAGMSAIARVLVEQGYTVSGSDRGSNDMTEALARDGATIYKGHDAAYIAGADMLIITSAVKDDHVEVAAARAAGIPVYKRQDVMAALMEGKKVIAVAGTKGKTTTTSMIVHILRECYMYPSYIVGGITGNTATNAGVDPIGKIFVVEADEYDNMFLGLRPDIAVITNVEYDHPDFFKSREELLSSYQQFVNLLPENGTLLACADDPVAFSLANERRLAGLPAHTYGLSEQADIRAVNIHYDKDSTDFEVEFFHKDILPGSHIQIHLPGKHNIQNALAAYWVSVGWSRTGTPSRDRLAALESFKPTARRFELRADVGGVAVVDDYAHNPMSIRAVLDAARQRYPDREVWAVWQPHTYSRTQALFNDFVTAFKDADHVLITDIYAARENPIDGVSSKGVVAAMTHPDVRHTATFEDTVQVLRDEVKAPAVILIMSAGDAPQIGVDYLKALQGEGGS
jgi:UDP-N-acetylmuramate--alanine ligase